MATSTIPGWLGGDLPEKERLAYEEGHDADLPSNIGVVNGPNDEESTKEKANVSSNVSVIEPMGDPEKGPTIVADEQREEREERDPNIVDWDGPDDPANPRNWYSTSSDLISGLRRALQYANAFQACIP